MYIQQNNDHIAASYDATPYQSFPFKQSHPAHLFTLGTLFKMQPTPVEKARILELGCSAGGNIIPVAAHYPNTQCLGIDFSETEIASGMAQIKDLALKNMELRHQSILDFGKTEGLFDYIICHGVFSWVDEKVQQKILQICKENLKPNGIAYISYNTLPGWNMMTSIRDLMLWHTQAIEDPQNKIAQARMILKFMTDGLAEDISPYAQFLKQEIKVLSKQADSYILHEHLSHYNKALYFHQFMEQASKHQLSYLSDAMLSTMYAGNMPKSFSEELSKVHNIIATNQYMDFIRNNRFRCTLLCHQEYPVDRRLNVKDVSNLYLQLHAKLNEAEFTEEMIHSDKVLKVSLGAITMTAQNAQHKAVLYVLHHNRYNLIHYNELKEQLRKYCPLPENQLDHLLIEDVNLMRMILAGLLYFSTNPSTYTTNISEKPIACRYARYQAKTQNFVTNRLHQVMHLDPFAKTVLPYLDGEHDRQSITALMTDKAINGELILLKQDQKPVTSKTEKMKLIKQLYQDIIVKLANSALIIG
ncbi:methyltransferase regulatory domain-containing protein [Candidatus Berkiella cookevillensis]|uniref:Cyclopropane fatty acyl phospholipid synthase n=1 Tax=Candidatus Berkiella cookevillensis TaxID=437022 RepID=A0A0Q9YS00_9GAMM|nr:class I SAM-dependent methyltransferase [Candidatus Berkiella cookevillensis]MCS5708879.1 methyltransferase regulatory domain-containing protein [Candidatus Berkiella cookevillensis]